VSITELLTVLFPQLACLCVERVLAVGRSVRIVARTREPEAVCPYCGVRSDRVHSRYERRVSDMAISGRETLIQLQVRRFFCGNDGCERKTFAEQVPGLTVRYDRRSLGLAAVLRAVAVALGGRPGARLADRLGAAVSRMTLLRLLRGLPEPSAAGVPRVLGVDDFALRRGHRYGTVLVDIEAGRPIEVLTDRSADTFAAWLQAHPGVEVICRDRAGCYAEAATRAAPHAVQVADRWHLWHNLGQAVERTVAQHRGCLPEPDPPREPDAGEQRPSAPAPAQRSAAGRLAERTTARHAAVHGLLADGYGVKAIARELRLARGTVRRFARAQDVAELLASTGTGRRPSILEEHKPYLHQRWNAGVTNAATLFTELREKGFRGSYETVRDYIATLRSTGQVPAAPPPSPPTVRETVGWIMSNPDDLDADHEQRLAAILGRCPRLRAARGHVRAFADMMNTLGGRDLEKWMTSVEADDLPALRSFVTGLRRDQDAVTAGLTMPWNSGPVEGHVNRIKTIKRQMYGRANPDLLRVRVLHAD